MKLFILISMIFSLMQSCDRGEPDDPVPSGKLNIIWQERLDETSNGCSSMIPLVTTEGVLFSKFYCMDTMPIYCRNKTSGEIIWVWDDLIEKGYTNGGNTHQINENEFLIALGHGLYKIDVQSGITNDFHNWRNNDEFLRAHNMKNGFIFNLLEKKSGVNYEKLVVSGIDNYSWNTIVEIHEEDGFEPGVRMPSSWQDKDGNIKLLLNYYLYDRDNDSIQVTFKYFDLTNDTVIWDRGAFDGIKYSGFAHPPILKDGKAWIQTSDHVVCIRLSDGKELWRRQFGEQYDHLVWTPNIMVDNVLVVNTGDRHIFGLNPENGNTLWSRSDSGSAAADMKAHNGVVYFGSGGTGKLYAVDVHTGDQLWAEDSPNEPFGSFYIGVDIDPDLGYLYTSDGIYAMCIKLPER